MFILYMQGKGNSRADNCLTFTVIHNYTLLRNDIIDLLKSHNVAPQNSVLVTYTYFHNTVWAYELCLTRQCCCFFKAYIILSMMYSVYRCLVYVGF